MTVGAGGDWNQSKGDPKATLLSKAHNTCRSALTTGVLPPPPVPVRSEIYRQRHIPFSFLDATQGITLLTSVRPS